MKHPTLPGHLLLLGMAAVLLRLYVLWGAVLLLILWRVVLLRGRVHLCVLLWLYILLRVCILLRLSMLWRTVLLRCGILLRLSVLWRTVLLRCGVLLRIRVHTSSHGDHLLGGGGHWAVQGPAPLLIP